MLPKDKNELLCRIEGDAVMGQMMRRYWMPALRSEDLVAGGAPKRVRLFGEDLAAFRSPDGTLGLVDEFCPHRGASLVLARNEECGLRCIYHGWLMDKDGKVLETPAEGYDSKMHERITFTHYKMREAGGLVWAYMGPAEHEPPLPALEFTRYPDSQIVILRAKEHANWAQCLEGAIDSAHSNYLHSNGIKPSTQVGTITELGKTEHLARPSNDGAPRFDVESMPYGFRYAALRKPIHEADKNKYVRVTLFVAPNSSMIPAAKGWGSVQYFVPIDDHTTMFYYILWKRDGAIDAPTRKRYDENMGLHVGSDMDENFVKIRNRENTWLQDRAAMMRGDTFSGIHGINMEDIAVHESMGPVCDRSKEHLGASDLAVIHFRRMMLDSAERFATTGEAPLGLRAPVDYGRLHTGEGMVPHDERWQMVMEDGAPEPIAAK
ncbi:MAG: Rieske 2Fe-2S domain-containing protein [Beijerinckiaceae bacterium]|nr:Rieske 2Fe-2S domain-containing protein [Beijerinckiaceae bacterium]